MKRITLYILSAILITVLGAALFITIRMAGAAAQVEREWRSTHVEAPEYFGSTSRLEILPLYEEDQSGDGFIGGHGVSYLIRADSATILMDVGNNPDKMAVPPFTQNMRSLGISPHEIDVILISHPHPDHLGGVQAWSHKTISLGEEDSGLGDLPVFVPVEMNYPGAIYSSQPVLLSPAVATTGVISYPEVFPISLFEPKVGEHGLVVNVTGEGLVLITGCGHPTLERLVERAEALYDLPVVGVVGGLHYEGATASEVEEPIQFLQTRQPKLVALSPHDSSPQAIAAFQSAFPEAYRPLQIGALIQFP